MNKEFSLLGTIAKLYKIGFVIFIVLLPLKSVYSLVQLFQGEEASVALHLNITSTTDSEMSLKLYGSRAVASSSEVTISTMKYFVTDFKYKLLAFIDEIIICVLSLYSLWLFKLIFSKLNSVTQLNDVFQDSIYYNLKKISLVFIFGGIYSFFKSVLFTIVFIEDLSFMNQNLEYSLDPNVFKNVLFGIIIIIIAQVYKKGIQLKEENELTI